MKVWYHIAKINGLFPNNNIYYLYVFTGKKDKENYIKVDKVILRFGKSNAFFQSVGEKILAPNRIELQELQHDIIDVLFQDEFSKDGSFK